MLLGPYCRGQREAQASERHRQPLSWSWTMARFGFRWVELIAMLGQYNQHTGYCLAWLAALALVFFLLLLVPSINQRQSSVKVLKRISKTFVLSGLAVEFKHTMVE